MGVIFMSVTKIPQAVPAMQTVLMPEMNTAECAIAIFGNVRKGGAGQKNGVKKGITPENIILTLMNMAVVIMTPKNTLPDSRN